MSPDVILATLCHIMLAVETSHTAVSSQVSSPAGAHLVEKVAEAYVPGYTFDEGKDTKAVLSRDGLATHLLYPIKIR